MYARGRTKLSNLAMLCRRHHRAVHEEGYQIERSANDTLTFRWPNGETIPDVPDPPTLPTGNAVQEVCASRRERHG